MRIREAQKQTEPTAPPSQKLFIILSVFWIRIGFNADLDTIEILMLLDAFYINHLTITSIFLS
jgi:hypothetical protein